jgi:hypothetical protein
VPPTTLGRLQFGITCAPSDADFHFLSHRRPGLDRNESAQCTQRFAPGGAEKHPGQQSVTKDRSRDMFMFLRVRFVSCLLVAGSLPGPSLFVRAQTPHSCVRLQCLTPAAGGGKYCRAVAHGFAWPDTPIGVRKSMNVAAGPATTRAGSWYRASSQHCSTVWTQQRTR